MHRRERIAKVSVSLVPQGGSSKVNLGALWDLAVAGLWSPPRFPKEFLRKIKEFARNIKELLRKIKEFLRNIKEFARKIKES